MAEQKEKTVDDYICMFCTEDGNVSGVVMCKIINKLIIAYKELAGRVG